ncbi:hypothetical protein NOVOSPHI9U_30041 [Novosphingobium sp. 9U]|nr:hypothetical protein NOVOSPHI9U_30041 [Novosphingobium sp. 9U]
MPCLARGLPAWTNDPAWKKVAGAAREGRGDPLNLRPWTLLSGLDRPRDDENNLRWHLTASMTHLDSSSLQPSGLPAS